MRLRRWLDQGPFTLTMSSGFFGIFSHLGFVQALFEEGYRPRDYRGCSAGAIIGAALASGRTTEDVATLLLKIRKEDFWDPALGFGLLKGHRLSKLLQTVLPEDFQNLKQPLAVSVFNLRLLRTECLRDGELPLTVLASCSIPGLFQPVRLRESLYVDGALRDPYGVYGMGSQDRALIHDISDKTPFGLRRRPSHLVNSFFYRPAEIPRCGPGLLDQAEQIRKSVFGQAKAALRQ